MPKNPPAPIELEPIVISTKRLNEGYGSVTNSGYGSAENVAVYTAEMIQALPARDLGEALNYIPGVDLSINNKFGQATSVVIGASDSRQVLVMVDGIPFNTQLSGQANPAKIPLGNIKRIEVIRGAASSAWGSSLGGVINVITKDPWEMASPYVRLTDSFAAYNTFEHNLELSGHTPQWGFYAFGNYFQSDGIRPQADSQQDRFFTKLSRRLGEKTRITGSFGYTGSKVNDLYYSPYYTETHQPTYTRYGKLQLDSGDEDSNISLAVKYNNQFIRTEQQYIYLLGFVFFSSTSSSVVENVYYGLSLDGNKRVRDNDLLVYGVDVDWSTLKSSLYLSDSKDIRTLAPYANYTFKLNQWDIIPGVRYDDNEHFGHQLSPSVGVT